MYTLWEIDNIIKTKKPDLRVRRARYAIKRIDETIATYTQLGVEWPALFQSMRNDQARLRAVINP